MHSDPIMRRMHACVLSLVPCNLIGNPGCGKTARVKAYAAGRKLHLERWLLSRAEPIDLKPRVYADGRVLVLDPPEIDRLVQLAAKAAGVIAGILFLDELNRSTREVEGAALDRIDAPPGGVAVVSACNPPSRGQAARSLEAAAANRFCHLTVEGSPKAWAEARIGGWPLPEAADLPVPSEQAMAKAMAKASALVSSFIRAQPSWLEKCPDNPVHAGQAWPSDRSWDNGTKVHAAALALGLNSDDTRALIEGCVGEAAAVEYLAYVVSADLPAPEQLLADPEGYKPSRLDRMIAALTAVVGAVQSDFTEDRWIAAWRILGACKEDHLATGVTVGVDMFANAYRALSQKDLAKAKGLTEPHLLIRKYTPRAMLVLAGAG